MERLKILLLSGIHPSAASTFAAAGLDCIDARKEELCGNSLIKALRGIHILGIRSGVKVTADVLSSAPDLLAIGCFCIGTNQVDLRQAKLQGIPVFNAPFSNTRSVAELVIAEIILLMRGIPAKNAALRRGEWRKSAAGSFEVRGKTLGIVGYGHIGTQVGILAEALGMHVLFYDIETKLALGNARAAGSLRELLGQADVVTLHVPQDASTANMIDASALSAMKPGARLINAARGNVVDIAALVDALRSKHVGGAAIDVHPEEPGSSAEEFISPLHEFDSVLLTPHVGGSTMEAQESIGREVAGKLSSYARTGSTATAVNFAEVSLCPHGDRRRLLHIHRNVPGVLAAMNKRFAVAKLNIAAQLLQTDPDIGYVVTDVDSAVPADMCERLSDVPGTIRCRMLS